MVRSALPSQNVQNISVSGDFWKLRCRKSARGCGAKRSSTSKFAKDIGFGPSFEIQKVLGGAGARDSTPSRKGAKREGLAAVPFTGTHTSHNTPLHCIPLHSIPLDYVTTALVLKPLNYSALPCAGYITLHYATLHYTTSQCITVQCAQVCYATLGLITLHTLNTCRYTTRQYITLHYITLRCN